MRYLSATEAEALHASGRDDVLKITQQYEEFMP